MEHLETYEEEKRRLIENSQRHKEELAEQLKEITAHSKKLTTNALVIGGSLILTYLVVRQFAGGKTRNKKNKNKKKQQEDEEDEVEQHSSVTSSIFSQVGDALITHASIILLDLAKEKLSNYLESRKAEDEDS
ncbi:MAG: hypothetical protein RLN86_13935 [Cyclobacteriaceae bacterium]